MLLLQIILTQISLLWLSDSGRLYGWATVVLLGRLLLRLQRKGRNRSWFLPSQPDLIQMECAGQHLWIGLFFCDHSVIKALRIFDSTVVCGEMLLHASVDQIFFGCVVGINGGQAGDSRRGTAMAIPARKCSQHGDGQGGMGFRLCRQCHVQRSGRFNQRGGFVDPPCLGSYLLPVRCAQCAALPSSLTHELSLKLGFAGLCDNRLFSPYFTFFVSPYRSQHRNSSNFGCCS